MSESSAITNVVNSLKSLRDEYQGQLRDVPQYAAFLQIEQSAAKVADALGIATGSTGLSIAHDVMSALETAQYKFKQHLETVAEYRALLSINNLIDELNVGTTTAEVPVATPEPVPAPIAAAETAPVESVPDYGAKVEAALQDETPATVVSADIPSDAPPAVAASADSIAATPVMQPAVLSSEGFSFVAAPVAPVAAEMTASPEQPAPEAGQSIPAASTPPPGHDVQTQVAAPAAAEGAERAA